MIKQFFKKVLISYLIIICCIFTPTYNAYAASAGGWSFSSFDVATSVVTALKNGASASVAVAKSPITSKIAKGILGGAIAGAALPLAISQLTGIALSAVDWVLDTENNAIKYKRKIDANTYDYKSSVTGKTYPTPEQACDYPPPAVFHHVDLERGLCYYSYNGSIVDWSRVDKVTPTNPYGSIPIPTVADKIYDNAKTDSSSRSVVNDAVKDYVNEGSADTALDNAKADADASHACGTGTHWSGSACVADTPTTPDTPFDPSSILDALQSLLSGIVSAISAMSSALTNLLNSVLQAILALPQIINTAIDRVIDSINSFKTAFADFVDWVKTEPTPTQAEPVDIQTPDMPQMESTDITFGGQCPQNFDIDIDLFGKPVKFTLFDSNVFCQFLSDWIRIPVIFSSTLVAVYILGGRTRD